ncbi:hypothetical protein Taro_054141 [Colocasia esculenta]|uniref:Uncharacterized protein n=1 Tax=Colocasia esculenta TaxID=4460 RepID=A0A843XQA5_COLES|nr:hypothetical protein [Colocasia esculenta]
MFDVPYEDMVRGARSGSSFARRLSSGRASMASALGPYVPPPLAVASGPFAPPPPRVASMTESFYAYYASSSRDFLRSFYGPSASTPPVFVAGSSTVPQIEDVVNLPEGGGRFYDGTLR